MGNFRFNPKALLREDILFLAAAYFFSGAFGLSFASINKSASAIWPPTGLAVAVLILKGRSLWPGVFIGAFLVNISTQGNIWTSLGIATGNTLEAYSGAWLVRKYAGGEKAFDSIPNVFGAAFLAGIMSTAISASIGVTSLYLGHFATLDQFSSIWITWWLGDMVSVLSIAPLLMLWMRYSGEKPKLAQMPEAMALIIVVLLVGRIAFLGKNPFGGLNQPLEYMAILPLLWAAFRFGARGAILTAVIMSGIALYGTRHGMGPFALRHPNESMLMLQAFMGTITVTSLVLAIIISDRRAAEQRLQVQDAVSRVLAESATIADATPAIFHALCEKGGWEAGAIWDFDRVSNCMRCLEFWRTPTINCADFEKVTKEFRFTPGTGLPGRVWSTGTPAWVPDVANDENFSRRAAAALSGIRAAICFPIKVGNEVLGIIECFSRHVRRPDDNFVQMLAGIGLQLGQFIERKRVDEARARLATIVESSVDAVFSIALDGSINTWNPSAERMFGFAATEALGKPIRVLIPYDRAHEEPAILERIKSGDKIEHYQTVRITKDGTRLDVSLSVSPMKDTAGRIIGASKIARDITEEKKTERALTETREMLRQHAENLEKRVRERTAELQETIRSLDSFCYSIAHDLRAPLRAMSGFGAELMEQYASRLDSTGQEYLFRIRSSAARMDRLICDLLELGRLGTMDVPAECLELQEVLNKALVPLEKELETRCIEVQLTKPLLTVRASSVMLEQVLANLLANAVKFVAPNTQPRVQVWSEPRGSMVRVCVQDNGIGIKPEHINKLFQPFTRLVNGVDYPGTGIGLAIVRKGVERMGGQVGVQSEPGKGSCFWIELPAVGEQTRGL